MSSAERPMDIWSAAPEAHSGNYSSCSAAHASPRTLNRRNSALIAIQLTAIELEGKISLIPIKVLDAQMSRGANAKNPANLGASLLGPSATQVGRGTNQRENGART